MCKLVGRSSALPSSLPVSLPLLFSLDPYTGATCTSPVVDIVAVEDSPDGLYVTATAATPDNPEHREVTTLPGVHLPSEECGEGYTRCPLKCDENGEESLICSFPATNSTTGTLDPSIALLHLKHGSDLVGLQLVQEKLVSVPYDINCAPVEVFDRGPNADYRHPVACLNLTAQDASYAYFLLLEYDRANISSARLKADTPLSGQYYLITEHSFSNLLYWESPNTACFIRGNIFMKDGSRVVTFELRDNPKFRQLEEHHKIEDCLNTLDFSTFESGLLRIQCSDDDVVLYDVCRTETVVERYNSTLNGTVYQCSEARINLLLNGTFLDIRPYGTGRDDVMDNLTLPFDDIIRAKCTGKEIPALFLTRKSGETYLLFLTSGHRFYLAQNSCIGNSCLSLDILRTKFGYIAGTYDYSSNEYVVANLSCSESPVIARVPFASLPDLTALVLSKSTRPCPCTPQQPTTEPMETPTEPSIRSPTVPSSEEPSTKAPTGPEIPIQPQGIQDGTYTMEGNDHKAVIAGSCSAGVVLLVFLTVVVIVM